MDLEKLEFGFSIVPVHNEPVIHDSRNVPWKIARYAGDVSLGVKAWRFHGEADYRAWFLNDWQTDYGHGLEAWRNVDYGFSGVSHEIKLLGAIDLWRGLQATTEYRESRQQFGSYYWLIGLRYKVR